MGITAALTFATPNLEGTTRLVHADVTVSLMMLAYTAINIPYSALLGVLTPDSDDRTSVSSYRFVMALLPVFIIVNTTLPLVEAFGGSDISPYGWQMAMTVHSVVAVVLFFVTFAMTRERVQPPAEQRTSLRLVLRDLFRNKPWAVLCVADIAALAYADIRNSASIYYFEYVVPDGQGFFSPVITTGAAAFIVGVMLTSLLAKRFDKRNLYMMAMSLTAHARHGLLLRPTRERAAHLGNARLDQSLCRPDRTARLGHVRGHGRRFRVAVGPPRRRPQLLGGFLCAGARPGHRRRGRRVAARLLQLRAQRRPGRTNDERHHADDELHPGHRGPDRGRRARESHVAAAA